MIHPDTAEAARAACLARLGIDVRFTLLSSPSHVLYEMRSDVAPFIHSKPSRRFIVVGPHHASVSRKAFARMAQQQRIDLLVDCVRKDVDRNGEHYHAIGQAVEMSRGTCADLLDLKVELSWSSGRSAQIKTAWRGLGNDLVRGRQVQYVEHDLSQDVASLSNKLVLLARRERRLRLLAANGGIVLDAPLAAFLKAEGRTADEFVEAARRHGFSKPREGRHDPAPGPMRFAGREVSVTFSDGFVSSRFELGDGVSWSKGCLTARDVVLPDSVVSSIKGRPLREVVDHPWLDGLVASSATQTRGRSGTCVTITTRKDARAA